MFTTAFLDVPERVKRFDVLHCIWKRVHSSILDFSVFPFLCFDKSNARKHRRSQEWLTFTGSSFIATPFGGSLKIKNALTASIRLLFSFSISWRSISRRVPSAATESMTYRFNLLTSLALSTDTHHFRAAHFFFSLNCLNCLFLPFPFPCLQC